MIIGDVQWVGCLSLIENSQQQRQTGAAVESFRNETVKENQKNRTMYEDMMKQQAIILPVIVNPLENLLETLTMNLTVIIDDRCIYIDGFVVQPGKMSWFNPDDYDRKLMQFSGKMIHGEIEYTEGPQTPIDNIDWTLKDAIGFMKKLNPNLKRSGSVQKTCELDVL